MLLTCARGVRHQVETKTCRSLTSTVPESLITATSRTWSRTWDFWILTRSYSLATRNLASLWRHMQRIRKSSSSSSQNQWSRWGISLPWQVRVVRSGRIAGRLTLDFVCAMECEKKKWNMFSGGFMFVCFFVFLYVLLFESWMNKPL